MTAMTSFGLVERLDDLREADVSSGHEPDKPDGEDGDVADQPHVQVPVVRPGK